MSNTLTKRSVSIPVLPAHARRNLPYENAKTIGEPEVQNLGHAAVSVLQSDAVEASRLQLADAVEKVRRTLTTRNNRIARDGFLNLCCAFGACFESILLRAPPKNRFSTASARCELPRGCNICSAV
jgi:hypothetical protein